MQRGILALFTVILLFHIYSCENSGIKEPNKEVSAREEQTRGNFQYDLTFLKNHQELLLLSSEDQQNLVVVCPGWQGRVMTSSAEGLKGKSLGWINYDLIKSKTILPHINSYGGEDRFWLGPEGGQYSIFFKKGFPFDLEHWQTPPEIDTEPFFVKEKLKEKVSFTKDIELENYQGTKFNLQVKREISLIEKEKIKETFHTDISNLKVVGFQSFNTITNTGNSAWTKSKGLLSIWILGMFPASEKTNVIIPFKGSKNENIVNNAYFGKLTDKNLIIKNNKIYFKADGKYRSKIGITQEKADSVLGSYDAERKVLTIIIYSLPPKPLDYVNSLWKIQEFPFKGDVINAYNDGPTSNGSKGLGVFYELESSSPAVELKIMESISHTHKTFHFYGNEHQLNQLTNNTFGVSLSELKDAFN